MQYKLLLFMSLSFIIFGLVYYGSPYLQRSMEMQVDVGP